MYQTTGNYLVIPLMGEEYQKEILGTRRKLLALREKLERGDVMSDTLDYYNKNAASFFNNTAEVNMGTIQKKFLSYLPEGSFILDLGCGSGRDTKLFHDNGYRVEAMDGSEEMCKLAAKETGLQVKHVLFSDFHEENKYDAVWACASILHLPKNEMKNMLERIAASLQDKGIFYTSFKYGDYEGEKNGRYFSYYTEETLNELLSSVPSLELLEEWISVDARKGREDEKWINVILRKK